MNIVVDESVDKQIADALRQAGFDTIYILEASPGVDDDSILQLANDQERILVTQDKDFGELVYRLGMAHFGVVLIRLPGLSPDQKAVIVAEYFNKHQEEFMKAFTVIQPAVIRIRKPKDI